MGTLENPQMATPYVEFLEEGVRGAMASPQKCRGSAARVQDVAPLGEPT